MATLIFCFLFPSFAIKSSRAFAEISSSVKDALAEAGTSDELAGSPEVTGLESGEVLSQAVRNNAPANARINDLVFIVFPPFNGHIFRGGEKLSTTFIFY